MIRKPVTFALGIVGTGEIRQQMCELNIAQLLKEEE